MTMVLHELSEGTYKNYRYDAILWLEQNGKVALTPYSDNPTEGGYATIGAGFKIDSNWDEILGAVGFNIRAAVGTAEYEYMQQIKALVGKNRKFTGSQMGTLINPINLIMQKRAADPNVDNAIAGQSKRTEFAFRDMDEVKATFQVIADKREEILDDWLHTRGTWMPYSNERLTLLSMVYNNVIGFDEKGSVKSRQLLDAINNGNRAEAWFQIRYLSNKKGTGFEVGIAKRRYYESDFFGLYDAGSKTPDQQLLEAKTIISMYTRNKSKIDSYDKLYGTQVAAANSAYHVSWVKTLTDDLKMAKDDLIANFAGGSTIDNVFVGKGLSTYEYLDKGAYRDKLVGTDKADLIFGEKGSDEITGGKGDDILYGGEGHDIYIYKVGDGNDKIIDSGENTIIIEDANGKKRTITNVYKTGAEVWTTADKKVQLTHHSPWQLITEDGGTIELGENFRPGDFGINLIEMPDNPVTTNRIVGDTDPSNLDDVLHDTAANDLIESGGGDDYIFGGLAGKDWVKGGAGDDGITCISGIAEGGEGSDIIAGGLDCKMFGDKYGEMSDLITAGESAQSIADNGDVLGGGSGNNFIYGSNARDILFGGNGDDLLVGGGGDDAILGDTEYLGAEYGWSFSVVLDGTYSLSLDKIHGYDENYNGDDTIYAGTGNDYVSAGGGNDEVYGGTGDDVIFGWAGDDFIDGGDGNDILSGDNGIVYLSAEQHGDDYIDGGAGNDQIWGEGGSDTLFGGDGDDKMYGDEGDDYIDGGAGNDLLLGGTGDNAMYGDDGNDQIWGGSGADYIEGGAGDDSIVAYDGDNTLYGDDGNDRIWGGANDDYIYGGSGADSIVAYDGDNTLYGDDGNDQIWGGSGADYIEGGAGDDSIVAYDGDNTLYGDDGNDQIWGGANNDYIDGGTGDDSIYGGAGNDTYRFGIGSGVDTINNSFYDLQAGYAYGYPCFISVATTETVEFGPGITVGDLALEKENNNLRINIVGTGDALVIQDWFSGDDHKIAQFRFADGTQLSYIELIGSRFGPGACALAGTSGADIITGDYGADTMAGGPGNDTYVVNNIGDMVLENDNEGTDTVQSSITYTLGDNVENLTLTGTNSINGTGNELDNVIIGNRGNNVLSGLAGDDYISAASGNNIMDGGAGNDALSINGGSNSIEFIRGDGSGPAQIHARYNPFCSNSASAEGGAIVLGESITPEGLTMRLVELGLSPALMSIESLTSMYERYWVESGGKLSDLPKLGIPSAFRLSDFFNCRLAFADGAILTIEDILQRVNDEIHANSGNGRIESLDRNDYVSGGGGVISDGPGNDEPYGNDAGNDVIAGGHGNDRLRGGQGNDVYAFNRGDGHDRIDNRSQTSASDVDTISFGNNIAPSDIAAFIDTDGNLVLSVQGSDDTVSVLRWFDPANGYAEHADAKLAGVQFIDQDGHARIFDLARAVTSLKDSLIGANADNPLSLFSNSDFELTGSVAAAGGDYAVAYAETGDLFAPPTYRITGTGGDDIITGHYGVDTMAGGPGNDTYVVNNLGDVVVENAKEGADTVQSSITYTLRANVENLTLTGKAAINGTGNELNNVLIGNNADNVLDGGTGADTMIGGPGNDTYVIDNVGDTVIENSNQGTDTVQSSITYILGANVENITLTGTSAINGTGNVLDNVLTGNAANNVLNGGAGNDTLDGGAGADIMKGGLGNDTYVIDTSGDAVIENANEGTDTVKSFIMYTLGSNVENLTLTGTSPINGIGNALNNVIAGNGSDNILDGSAGADTMIGGLGDDTYVVDNAGDIVTENANEGTDTVQSSITYTLSSNVENLTLTGGSSINGTGNELDNILIGNGAANTLIGGSGNDTINGGGGADKMIGGTADDIYFVDNSADIIVENANEGTDTVQSNITYTLGTNLENLVLTGTSAINGTGNLINNSVAGNSADNMLDGGAGADIMKGGSGNDTYVVDNIGDAVIENVNEGTDTVRSSITYTLGANVEKLTLIGAAAVNGTGNAINNVIAGNGSDNILDGNTGADTMLGGKGNDTYIVDNAGDVVTENGNEGIDTVQSSISYILGSNVENLVLAGTSAINGTGNALNNFITGNSADNKLDGGAGADTMKGGLGSDTYVVDNAGDIVTENADEGTDTVQSFITYALGANIENLILTGGSAINGTGNALNNIITGNNADNVLDGGAGADTMKGGLGNDTYVIDNIGDAVIENANEGIDTVKSSISYNLGTNIENLTLTGISAINGTGNALNNFIAGNSADNMLDGGAGADKMYGGGGNDTYIVDNYGDYVCENSNSGIDTVQSSVTFTLGANIEKLSLTGASAINGTGNALSNIIAGNSGNNTLTGGDGSDTLEGGAGADYLHGDRGNDTYKFGKGSGADIINNYVGDYATTTDTIAFSVNPLDLIYSKSGNNLTVAINRTTDNVAVQNWYSGASYHTDKFSTADGRQLLDTQVDQLIQAMASFCSDNGITWSQAIQQKPTETQAVLATYWQQT